VTKAQLRLWVAAALLAGMEVLLAIGYRNPTAAPIVRHLDFKVPDTPPVTILLFSDVHVHGPDMSTSRLAKIVEQINAPHRDVVAAAGDFIDDNWVGRTYSVEEAIAPLSHLRPPLGVYAVLGNNDYALDSKSSSFTGVSVRVGRGAPIASSTSRSRVCCVHGRADQKTAPARGRAW
jgi:hypothetical protein